MLKLGYNATLEYNLFSFSNTLKQKTYDMLREGLPVVARGNPAGSLEGHVWVIDGSFMSIGGGTEIVTGTTLWGFLILKTADSHIVFMMIQPSCPRETRIIIHGILPL